MRRGHQHRPSGSRRRAAPEAPGASRRGEAFRDDRRDLLTGTLSLEPDGSGRLLPDQAGLPSVHVPPEDVGGLQDGEPVTVRLEVGRKGRVRGRIVARGFGPAGEIVGIVHASGGAVMLVPEPEGPALALAPANLGGAQHGDAVAARVLDFGRGGRMGSAAVHEILGRPGDPKVQVEMLVRGQGLPMRFSEAAIAEAAIAPAVDPGRVLAADPTRRDLRPVPHVTIDGEDARDFDDAVGARAEDGGVRVWVSIADVSHYVLQRCALDDDARARGTSVYFPHRAVPMLPERLSSDLCSLVPGAPRLTLTCELRVRPDGKAEDVRVYPSIIESAGRLTYGQVQAAIDGKGGPAADHVMLPHLVAASRALRARRQQRGAIELDVPEAQVLLGPDGAAVHIRERPRLEAHRLIEDLMIAANEAVAELLAARGWPAVYRVHELPDPVRIAALAEWAGTLGLHLDPAAARKPRTLAKLALALRQREQGFVGMTLLLRSLARARYAHENLGHYGLGSRAYLHFTSPIRRYPDLLVHRSLKGLWRGERPSLDLEAAAGRASLQERRADAAEREVERLMACHVAEAHLGEIFDAVVTGVHRAGAFVRLREPWLEGLLPAAVLGEAKGEYYDVIEREQALVGRRSGHRLALGDIVPVRLTSVSTYRRQIDFGLVGPIAVGPRPGLRTTASRLAARTKAQRARPAREKRSPGRGEVSRGRGPTPKPGSTRGGGRRRGR